MRLNYLIRSILASIFCIINLLFGSGGYDNGTSTGKGKFQIDLTWNPFDRLKYGQTYAVLSYGLTSKFDIHGYISKHKDFSTWYLGLFYQFYKNDKIDLATAVGVRRRFDQNWTHFFAPQLLYTYNLSEKIFIGGSIVTVIDNSSKVDYNPAIDIGIFYRIKPKSGPIEKISIGVGAFRPATWLPDSIVLPTYSLDFNFK